MERTGSKAHVNTVRLWVESESGSKFTMPQDLPFQIELLWRKKRTKCTTK